MIMKGWWWDDKMMIMKTSNLVPAVCRGQTWPLAMTDRLSLLYFALPFSCHIHFLFALLLKNTVFVFCLFTFTHGRNAFFSSWLFAQIRIFSRLFLLFAYQMWLYRKPFGVTDQNLCSIILVWILHLSSGYCFLFHFKLIIGRLSDTIILFPLHWSGKNFHFQINSLVLL